MKIIAEKTAQLLVNILKDKKEKFTNIHAIGFCVGAQIVGYMGKLIKNNGITLNRVTGEQYSDILWFR